MLPDILKNANTPEGGARILDNMGVDKAFINDAYNKYSGYLTKIPGMNATNAKSILNAVTGAMRGGSRPAQAPTQTSGVSFDKSKYPRV